MLKEVKQSIKIDKKTYLGKKAWFYILVGHQNYIYYKALKYSRLYRYYKMNHKSLFAKLKFVYYSSKKNYMTNHFALELNGADFGNEFVIYHNNIVINHEAKFGSNCKLHGNNCIGNNGITNDCPIIGNNVDIGYGASIIGGITVADNVIVGANSVVNKSIEEASVVVAGTPAKIIRRLK